MTHAAHDYSKYIDNLGLTIAENDILEADDIAGILDFGTGLKSSASWVIGDMIVWARENANDEWINHLSNRVDLDTCNNYASIARKVPRSRRRANLSFTHHAAVSKLDPEQQNEWLEKAEREGMSRDELRQAIKDVAKVEKRTVLGKVGGIDKLLRLDFGLPEGFEVKISYEVIIESEAA